MDLFIILIPVIGLIFFLIFYYSKKQSIIRKLKRLPSSKITSLKTNEYVKLTGKALQLEAPLIAPFSKRSCIFYTIVIEEEKGDDDSSSWSTVIKDEKIQPFLIEQNGDYLLISPENSPKNYTSYLVVDSKTSSGTFNNPSPKFKALLNKYAIKSTNFLGFNRQLRYKEGIVEIGEEITVAGVVRWKTLKEPIKGYSYSKIATLESTQEKELIITDLPKAKVNKS